MTRFDIRSSVFWLSFISSVLLAGFFTTQPGANFLRTASSSLAEALDDLKNLFPTTSLSVASLPDTTAIVLNWSRLPNVIRIVSLLCSTRLHDTIAEIVVWYNR